MEHQAALLGGGLWFPLGPRVVSFVRSRFFQKHPTSLKNRSKVSTSCSLNESSAEVIYSVAPAMGHNKKMCIGETWSSFT
ncbi:hypothetical protein L1987_33290 [Smallanthus sonchifolius]|uniref:Uncharacterized protein n=1 Tax=Smallanthus sonchifolius TaxID=185202 RepID=A0ACB9HQ45_9ASTR|nr:hypothetical protein L1987_33290 [Smallanthus sonchifolius]